MSPVVHKSFLHTPLDKKDVNLSKSRHCFIAPTSSSSSFPSFIPPPSLISILMSVY